MPAPLIAGFAGSTSQPSRTRALVEAAVNVAAVRFGAGHHVFDVNDLGASFPLARRLNDLDPGARLHLETLVGADALVIGSPVYKGSYSGLFKHLFDLLDPEALRGRPVLLAATGGGDRHALVIDHQLRPLFAFFEAASLPTAVYASDRDFADGRPTASALLERLDRAVDGFAPFFPSVRTAPLTPLVGASSIPLVATERVRADSH